MGGGPTSSSSVTPIARYSAACSLVRQRRTGRGRPGASSVSDFMGKCGGYIAIVFGESHGATASVAHRRARCVRERRRTPATVDNAADAITI